MLKNSNSKAFMLPPRPVEHLTYTLDKNTPVGEICQGIVRRHMLDSLFISLPLCNILGRDHKPLL